MVVDKPENHVSSESLESYCDSSCSLRRLIGFDSCERCRMQLSIFALVEVVDGGVDSELKKYHRSESDLETGLNLHEPTPNMRSHTSIYNT